TIDDPDRVTKLRVLNHVVEADSVNKLEIVYDLSSEVPVTNGVARAGFFMSDLTVGGRSFWEQYGPANYEFDQFSQKLVVRLNGASKTHKVYTNGDLTQLDNNTWSIQFPDYFTTSSFYFHLAEQGRFKER